MAEGYLTLTNGEFSLQESDTPNILYFFRNDGECLGDVGRIPMEFYQEYMARKMMEDGATEYIANNILFQTSDDGKIIRLTVYGFGENIPEGMESYVEEEESVIHRFVQWIKKITR